MVLTEVFQSQGFDSEDPFATAIQWAEAAGYDEFDVFNPGADRPRSRGGGGNHVVASRGNRRLRMHVSAYSGDTLVRSEVEKLLRRLEVPRTNEARPWPNARLCIVVGEEIAQALLGKKHPRRCSYWVVGTTPGYFIFEVLPVSDGVTDGGNGAYTVRLPELIPTDLASALRAYGADIESTDSRSTIVWQSPVGDEIGDVLASRGSTDFELSTELPAAPSATENWDAYWRLRALSPDVGRDLTPVSDAVMLRYLFRQNRVHHANRSAAILCVGSGLSLLPHALSAAGFEVTVLEPSGFALRLNQNVAVERSELSAMFRLTCEELGCSLEDLLIPGGSVAWEHGDLFEPNCCPGPYDIIVLTGTFDGVEEFTMRSAIARIDARLHADGWVWTVVRNNGFRWIDAQREFAAIDYELVPYSDLPDGGKAMSGGLVAV